MKSKDCSLCQQFPAVTFTPGGDEICEFCEVIERFVRAMREKGYSMDKIIEEVERRISLAEYLSGSAKDNA